jgi:hypothetical protein
MKKHLLSMLGEALATLFCVGCLVMLAPVARADIGERMISEAPELDKNVAKRAAKAVACSSKNGVRPKILIVVDMAKPATKKRLYAFDLVNSRLVTTALVSHGRGSDPAYTGIPKQFGNEVNSGMTSLGLYQVAEAYQGKHGLARRLDGLTRGFNDKARQRAVVMHSSKYVNPGAVGRSLGCPAVQPETLAMLERAGLTGALLWIDYPDKDLAKAVETCGASYKYKPAPSKRDPGKKNDEDGAVELSRWFGTTCNLFDPFLRVAV